MKYIYIVILTLSLFLSSCVEKMVIIPEWEAPQGNKTVLVEDLTGVGCTNCPTGAENLKSLTDLYGDKLIIVSIHGSELFTDPLKEEDYNLRNAFSDDIDDLLQPHLGKPAVGIDRTKFKDGFFGIPGIPSWAGYIEEAFKAEVLIDLSISTTWDEVTRNIKIDVNTSPQKNNLSGMYKLSVMLVESGIETAQKGPQGEIEDYEHHNVLRHMLTNYDGNTVNNTKDVIKTSFEHTLHAEDGGWKAENMSIIAFITDSESLEVIQSKIVALTE